MSHLGVGNKASYARETSFKAFKMFRFLQSLPSQCSPGEDAALMMDVIGCNINE